MSQTAKRLAELGIVLPKPAAPVANYVPLRRPAPGALPALDLRPVAARARRQARRAPQGQARARIRPWTPPREAARLCAINLLAQAQAALGDLDRIAQTVRLGGFFNVAGGFDPLPQAMNGASDLMVEVFGERGKHARTTVGVAHLPLNALAEVEAVFEVAS